MRKASGVIALAAAAGILAGCASPSQVVFVTKSSIGIDVDGTPATASIAYDRTEGYLGPRLENGSVPPVLAKISTDGQILNRQVRQYYATGTAANRLAGDSQTVNSQDDLVGDGKMMFFGTGTTLGVKIGFTTTVPDSFVFGYKRKEISVIPLGSYTAGGKTVKAYPSVIGVFGANVNAKTVSDTGLGIEQFFATGTAANALADNPAMKSSFQSFGVDAVEEYKESIRLQQRLVLATIDCFTALPDAKVVQALDNARALDLLDAAVYANIKAAASTSMSTARSRYVSVAASGINATPPDRVGRVEGHRVYVCGLK
jgi:hypothetical protein